MSKLDHCAKGKETPYQQTSLKLTARLIESIIQNDVSMVRELLNQGVDPTLCLDEANITPLHIAVQNNVDTEIVTLLIEAGANLTARIDRYGDTPLAIAILHNHERMIKILLAYLNPNICS